VNFAGLDEEGVTRVVGGGWVSFLVKREHSFLDVNNCVCLPSRPPGGILTAGLIARNSQVPSANFALNSRRGCRKECHACRKRAKTNRQRADASHGNPPPIHRLKKTTPSGSKCRVPAASVSWAPEIPSTLILAGPAPRKCELVHRSRSCVSKTAQASVPGAFFPARQPGIAPARHPFNGFRSPILGPR
jgi:hypothetical protein